MTETTNPPTAGRRGLVWLGLLLALGGPIAVVSLQHSPLISLPTVQTRAIGWAGLWAVVLVLLALVARVEKRPLASIGLKRFTGWSLLWGVLAGVLAIVAFPLCGVILMAVGIKSQIAASSMSALMTMPLWARLATLATAGFCEEVLYRGYPIRRLREITGSRIVAVVLPGAIFVALHAPSWGAAHLLYVSVVTVIMTVLFLWRGDLWSNIIAHLVTDGVPLILMPMLMRH